MKKKAKDPYDVDEDAALTVKIPDFAKEVSAALTAGTPITEDEFKAFVGKVVHNFKHCVENRGAWKLLWVKNAHRTEKIVQSLFDTSAIMACQERDVDFTHESDAGRGPVDFWMSRDFALRTLLGVKLAKRSSFKSNIENQVKTYADTERCNHVYYVIVQFTDKDCDPERMAETQTIVTQVAAANKMEIDLVFVDARNDNKPSASKIK